MVNFRVLFPFRLIKHMHCYTMMGRVWPWEPSRSLPALVQRGAPEQAEQKEKQRPQTIWMVSDPVQSSSCPRSYDQQNQRATPESFLYPGIVLAALAVQLHHRAMHCE